MKPNRWWERRTAAKGVIVGLALLLAGARPASAQDNPTHGPLRIDPQHPSTFVDRDGLPVWLSGSVSCCMADGDESGWPWVSEALLRQIAEVKNNYAYIRLGPYTRQGESWPFEAYEFVGGAGGCGDPGDCYDLDHWNQGFWDRLRQRVEYARDRGIYVEVDLIDGWVLKGDHPNPWRETNNTAHEELGNCSIQGTGPEEVHTRWLSKIVETIGDLDNVIFQVGNETGACSGGTSLQWEKGIADFVNQQLDQRSFPRHLISTNSEEAAIECNGAFQYINVHWPHGHVEDAPQSIHFGKPTGMNEYLNAETEDPDLFNNHNTFTRALWQGFTHGTMVHYWPGDDPGPIGTPSSQIGMALTRLLFFRNFVAETSFGRMEPQGGNVIAIPGREYVAFVDQGEDVTLDLGPANGFEYEWMHTWNGSRTARTSIWAGGPYTLTAPVAGGGESWVLHLFTTAGCSDCPPPANLEAAATGFAVTVHWQNQPVGIRRLVVRRWDSVGQQWSDVSPDLPAATTTFTDSSIQSGDVGAGRTYKYTVRAYFIFGGFAEAPPVAVDLHTSVPSELPQLLSPGVEDPANTAGLLTLGDLPTFHWVPPARATSYVMRVALVPNPGGDYLDVSYVTGASYTPSDPTVVARIRQNAGSLMRWSLKACNNMGCDQTPPAYAPDHYFILKGPSRGDFNADARDDLLFRSAVSGDLQAWFMGGSLGTQRIGSAPLEPPHPLAGNWTVAGVNDFDRDHRPDILWRNDNSGNFSLWLLDQYQSGSGKIPRLGGVAFPGIADLNWAVQGTGDFTGDGKPDIVFRYVGPGPNAGTMKLWRMNDTTHWSEVPFNVPAWPDLTTDVLGFGDFNGDRFPDILWRSRSTGQMNVWYVRDLGVVQQVGTSPATLADLNWKVVALEDLDADGKVDIVWQNQLSGALVDWLMDGVTRISGGFLTPSVPEDASLKAIGPR